jgi:hypothetical protein
MKAPRFTLRDVVLATTLIAVGVGGATVTIRHLQYPYGADAFWLIPVLLYSAASVGAGVFAPFHRKRQGAIVGALFAAAIFIVKIVSEVSWEHV